MLKWTLSQKNCTSSVGEEGAGSADRYQIKRAAVRVLRQERDKENSDPLLRRLVALARRGVDSGTTVAIRRHKSHRFDPRRIFSSHVEDGDSGSVYMRLDRMPAAVSKRPVNTLADATNTLRQTVTPSRNSMAEPIYGRLGMNDENIALVAKHSNVKEFTDKPNSLGLHRPVAVKGDSPEAHAIPMIHQPVFTRTVSQEHAVRCIHSESERRQLKLASRRLLGDQLTNNRSHLRQNCLQTKLSSSTDQTDNHLHRSKPIKKACVGFGTAAHAHTTTGQHIHPAGVQTSSAKLAPNMIGMSNIPMQPAALRSSTAKIQPLPAIRERLAERPPIDLTKATSKYQKLSDNLNPQIKCHFSANSQLKHLPSTMKQLKGRSSSEGTCKMFSCCCHPPNESIVSLSLESGHNVSLERGDSGISEGVTSPTKDISDIDEKKLLSTTSASQQHYDSYYFTRNSHLHTNPSVLDTSALCRDGVPIQSSRRRNSIVTSEGSHLLPTPSMMKDTNNSCLKRSRSFSDVSVLSSENISGNSDPFTENSGHTVIENPNSAYKKSIKFVRFMSEADCGVPCKRETVCSSEQPQRPLCDWQLYRSYQNIGTIFTGALSCKARQYAAAPTHGNSPNRFKPYSKYVATDETYLTMHAPVLKLTNKSQSFQDLTLSCADVNKDENDSDETSRCPAQPPSNQSTHIANNRVPSLNSQDECKTNWSLETLMSDTLPRSMSMLRMSEERMGSRSPSWCSVDSEASTSPLPDAINGMILNRRSAKRSLDAVFNPTYISPDIGPRPQRNSPSENSTLESWCSHRGSLRCPPKSVASEKINTEELPPRESEVEAVYKKAEVQRRATVRFLKSRRHRKPGSSSCRIWRHPRLELSHSTPNKSRRTCGSVLGPDDTYLNALTFTKSADSSLATSGWLSISGRKSRRVISTQLRRSETPKPRGQLKIRVYENSGLLTVHVIRARALTLRHTDTACNAYVKVSLVPDAEGRSYCRTRVLHASNQPVFDERFSFDFLDQDHAKRLLVSVWHRHLNRASSELLGCMSFGVRNLVTSEIGGWFRLLPENVGRLKHFAVRSGRGRRLSRSCASLYSVCDNASMVAVASGSPRFLHRSQLATIDTLAPLAPLSPLATTYPPTPPVRTGLVARQRVGDSGGGGLTCSQSASAVSATGGAPVWDVRRTCSDSVLLHDTARSRGGVRRALAPSRQNNSPLKAPYHRLRIVKGRSGFGLSLAWTCPPSVVSVEAGGSAEAAGLAIGDYVVRIGSHNVVLMAHSSGLDLIRKQDSVLDLVVFRARESSDPASLMELLRWV